MLLAIHEKLLAIGIIYDILLLYSDKSSLHVVNHHTNKSSFKFKVK